MSHIVVTDSTDSIRANREVDHSLILNEFSLLLNECRTSIPLTRIIQKSVRIAVCQELTNVITNVVQCNDIDSWMRLIAFPYIVLNTKSKGKVGMNVIRSNLNAFRKCKCVNEALSDILKVKDVSCSNKKSFSKEKLLINTVTRKVGEGDVRGAVRVLCSSESIAPQTPETVSKLRDKHPDDNGEVFEEIQLENTLPVTEIEDVIKAIRGFPVSSSGGIATSTFEGFDLFYLW